MARRCSTLCLPIGKDDYADLIGDPARFRAWLDQSFRSWPELFPKAFAWTDHNDSAWFGILMAALLPSVLMLWSYTTATGLTVFTDLVDLTVVTVAIPYLFSACAQLTYLVSKRRRVQGWALVRDVAIAGAGVLFSMWVTFAAGYQSVYQALILVLAGVVIYVFIRAHRENTGQVEFGAES